MKAMRRILMFSGEIGSLQPRSSYAVARTIGSTEMAQRSPARRVDQNTKTQSKQRRLLVIFLSDHPSVKMIPPPLRSNPCLTTCASMLAGYWDFLELTANSNGHRCHWIATDNAKRGDIAAEHRGL
jgi:hypothetical protein